MNLSRITPVILTYNEAPNIGRCLDQLRWARDIVVVDSFSTDETQTIIRQYPQARLFFRRFDLHARQWTYAINETNISSDWILALDADYVLSDDVIEEIRDLRINDGVSGYATGFIYKINGKALRGSFYPPVTVLYNRAHAHYEQDGHTQRLILSGLLEKLNAPILHDDKKSFKRWFESQTRYAQDEGEKLAASHWFALDWKDRIRKLYFLAPAGIFFYGLIGKGLLLDGWAGFVYCGQRFISESLLSIKLIEHSLKKVMIIR